MTITIEIPDWAVDLVKRCAAYEELSVVASIERTAVEAAYTLVSETEGWSVQRYQDVGALKTVFDQGLAAAGTMEGN